MNTVRHGLAIGIAIAVASSCTNRNGDLKSKPFLVGNYECVAYDQDGSAVVKGTLSINSLTDHGFKGDWRLDNSFFAELEEREYIHGTGDLVGSVSQRMVQINFNPGISDANWIVDGHIEGDRIVGVLRWSGRAGGVEIGRFEATRVAHP